MAMQSSTMFQVRKAERRRVKARVAFIGVSGTGKTMSALLVAKGLVGTGKIVLIDTEGGRGELYAGLSGMPDYDVISLTKPFTPDRYIAAIAAAEAAGAECIVVDSTSHAWAGEGGILEFVDDTTASSKSKNAYTEGWRRATPKHNALVEALVSSKAHMIVTVRAKAKYVEDERRGYKKVGLEPVQRDGLEYEFMLVLDIDLEHRCTPSKDNTNLFDGTTFRVTEQTGIAIRDWIASGKEGVAPPSEVKAAPKAPAQGAPMSGDIGGIDYDLSIEAALAPIAASKTMAELSLAYNGALAELKKLTNQRGETTGDEAREWHRLQMQRIAKEKDARKAALTNPPTPKAFVVLDADGMEVMRTDTEMPLGHVFSNEIGTYKVDRIESRDAEGKSPIVHVVSVPKAEPKEPAKQVAPDAIKAVAQATALPADQDDVALRQLELTSAS